MATTRSGKMMKKSKAEEVLSDKLSQITRSARVLQSPSCLGDGRLEGLSIWRREETSMGAGGWPKSHHPAECGPLESQWALAFVRIMRSAATIGQRMGVAGAEDGHILGRHTRPWRPHSAWCWLIARFMSAQMQAFEVWLVDRRPWR